MNTLKLSLCVRSTNKQEEYLKKAHANLNGYFADSYKIEITLNQEATTCEVIYTEKPKKEIAALFVNIESAHAIQSGKIIDDLKSYLKPFTEFYHMLYLPVRPPQKSETKIFHYQETSLNNMRSLCHLYCKTILKNNFTKQQFDKVYNQVYNEAYCSYWWNYTKSFPTYDQLANQCLEKL